LVEADYDRTWESLIEYVAGTFFGVDSFEKESGLITLSFTGEPWRYVDCGKVGAIKPTENLLLRPGMGATLAGRMNLVVRRRDEKVTRVRIHARYMVEMRIRGPIPQTWVFGTGTSATRRTTVGATSNLFDVVCTPTHEAEQAIVDAVDLIVQSPP
jgi:hypothetical protein